MVGNTDNIVFSSVLIGLLVGVQPVSVEVDPSISPAAVVFALDGKPVIRVGEAPWKALVDFGDELKPHEVSAEALGPAGERLARVSQLVNLPMPPARLDILVTRSPTGVPIGARLVATSVRRSQPIRLTLALDGTNLALDRNGEARLPTLDLRQAHVLSATAEFDRDAIARADVALGGGVADESGSRLTAVPLRVQSGSLTGVEELRGLLLHKTRSLAVVAVEKGPATVLLVRDPSAAQAERQLGRSGAGQGVRLDPNDRVGLVFPVAHHVSDVGQQSDLMESTPFFTAKEGGLLWVLTHVSRPKQAIPPYRYADAVAVAGLEGYRSGGRRAVVLVAHRDPTDTSRLTPSQARGYLERLGVPLHVWSIDGDLRTPWTSRTESLRSFVHYQRAAAALREDLETQMIAWVAGEWTPGQVSLSQDARGIALLR